MSNLLVKGFIDPGVIECSPPRTSGNIFFSIISLLILDKKPSDVLSNYTKIPQINKNINVKNKDIVNDKELKSLIKSIESDITVGRVLVRPSGTESKIRIMIEAQEERVAEKFSEDILKIIESKS